MQCVRGFSEAATEGAAQAFFIIAQWLLIVGAGVMTGAIGCATATRAHQFRCAVGNAEDQHTVMYQRQHHGGERGLRPPCRLDVEVKSAAGLPISAPSNHSVLVESMKYFNGAAILPNRVGLPKASPTHSRRSSRLA